MKKILSFTNIYQPELHQANTDLFKEYKSKLQLLIAEYFNLALDLNRSEIVIFYIKFIMLEENKTKMNLIYKLLKVLYISGKKGNNNFIFIIEKILEHINKYNYINEFLTYIYDRIEYFENKYVHFSSKEIENIPEKELLINELLKSLCIRIIDDFYIKIDKNKSVFSQNLNNIQTLKPSMTLNESFITSTTIKTIPSSTKNGSAFNSDSKKHLLTNSTGLSARKNSLKIYKNPILDRIVDIIIPTEYSIRSIFLTVFYTPNHLENFQYIKKSVNLSTYKFYSKDALHILITLFEKIALCKFKTDPLRLLKLSYEYIIGCFNKILDSQKEKEREAKSFIDIFQSNKIGPKFFYNCLNSTHLTNDFEDNSLPTEKVLNFSRGSINIDNNFMTEKTSSYDNIEREKNIEITKFKENIKKDLSIIIQRTINIHPNPFYFNLIFALYCKTDEFDLIIHLMNVLIYCLKKEKYEGTVAPSNMKNLLILIERMLFSRVVHKHIFKNEKLSENLINFLANLHESQIIYTKISFNIFSIKKQFKKEDGKQRMILEMVFDIYLELYYLLQDDIYLKMFEKLFILKSKNNHSLFYYMDMYHFFPKIESETIEVKFNREVYKKIESLLSADGIMDDSFSTYYFSVKIFVYIYEITLHNNNSIYNNTSASELATLINLAKILYDDIFILLETIKKAEKGFNSHRVEIKDKLYQDIKNQYDVFANLANTTLTINSSSAYVPVEKSDFTTFKTKFIDIIKSSPVEEAKKYYKFKGERLSSMIEKKLELSGRRPFSPKKVRDAQELTLMKSKSSNELLNSFNINKANEKYNDCSTYNSNEDQLKINTLYFQNSASHKKIQIEKKISVLSNISFDKNILQNSNKSFLTIKTEIEISPNVTIPQLSYNEDNLVFPNFPITDDQNKSISFNDMFIHKPKKEIILTALAIFFKDSFFKNTLFEKEVHHKYLDKFVKDKTSKQDLYTLSYPTKVKQIFTNNYQRIFTKPYNSLFENKYITVSHDYIEPNIECNHINNVIKIKPQSNLAIGEYTEEWDCEYITLDGATFGKIYIFPQYILFKSEFISNFYDPKANTKYFSQFEYIFSSLETDIIYREKEFKIYYNDVKEILVRRFLYMWQANEIFLQNGKSFYFNLFKVEHNKKFFNLLHSINIYNINIVINSKNYFKSSNFTKKWIDGEITNFEYLLIINKYSGRSYHDINQYPVFPWIIINYVNQNLDITDKAMRRDLSYPISVQLDEKKHEIIKKYEDDDGPHKFKVHYRTHYSNMPFSTYYLMRLAPFTQNSIKFQNMKFDHPNRMFNSLKETWDILEKSNDNRELSPEFYCQPEILINLNYNNFGVRNSDQKRVNDVVLPEWSTNAIDYIYKHRLYLDSKQITSSIHNWIDNVFGVNQLVKVKESLNVFCKQSYESEMSLTKKIEKYRKKAKSDKEIISCIRNKVSQILNFGQTPHKLFDEKHPKKIKDIKVAKGDEFTMMSDYVFSKQRIDIMCKKSVKFFNYSSNYIYVLNGEKEIEGFEKSFFKKKIKLRLKQFLNFDHFTILMDNNETSKPTECKLPIYRDKFQIIELKDCKYFISCRHIDNSFKVYLNENLIKEILCDSFVSSISKSSNEEILFTGHNNGKLILWRIYYEILKNDISITPINEIIAHEDCITTILVNQKLNILITSGEDGYVYIRNLYDLELLTYIKPFNKKKKDKKSLKIIDIKLSAFDLLYITCFDIEITNEEKFILFGYTLNGLLFCSKEGLFNNIDFTPTGRLLIGFYNINKIFVVDPIDFNKIYYEKPLDSKENSNILTYFSYTAENNYLVFGYLDGSFKRYILQNEKDLEGFI